MKTFRKANERRCFQSLQDQVCMFGLITDRILENVIPSHESPLSLFLDLIASGHVNLVDALLKCFLFS